MRKQPMDRESWLGELDPWCRRWLSAPVRQTLFLAGWQSSAVGVELSDGRQAVVKVRPPTPGLAVRQTCQRQLWATGFPCPRPLTGLTRLGPFAVSAEELLPHGTDRPEPAVEVPELARVLADLVARASTVRPEGSVGPPPDWAGWDRADPDVGPWPAGGPDEVDLNASREPAWLTGTVTTVGRRLRASPLPRVVGHVDWEPPNLSWSGPAIGAVFDWDSLTVLPEAAIAGLAAAVHPVVDDGPGASVEQTAAFLTAYAAARRRPWASEEVQVAWAAGLWVLAHAAKGEALDGIEGPATRHLLSGLDDRYAHAGLTPVVPGRHSAAG